MLASRAGGLINTAVGRGVTFVAGYLPENIYIYFFKKTNAIKASDENKQKIRDERRANRHVSALKWRGNKTPDKEPYSLVYFFTLQNCQHS